MRLRFFVEMRSMVSRSNIAALVSSRCWSARRADRPALPCRPGSFKALQSLVGQNANLVAQILFELGNIFAFNLLGPLVLLLPLRLKMRTSTIVPSIPGGQVSEASRTSPAFSPKIARSSFLPASIASRPWP